MRWFAAGLFTIGGVVLLLNLGFWQLRRLDEKEQQIVAAKWAINQPPVEFADLNMPDRHLDYLPVKLVGRYLHDEEQFLVSSSREEGPGYKVITPFVSNIGQIILVERGFVAKDLKSAHLRTKWQINDRLLISGILRKPKIRKWFAKSRHEASGEWLQPDIREMARMLDTEPILLHLQEQSDWPQNGLPRILPITVNLPNNHLSYAITWFMLAAVWFLMSAHFWWRWYKRSNTPADR